MAIDEDNVTDDSCLIDTQEVVLSNGDVTYTYTLPVLTPGQDDDIASPSQCSSPNQEEDNLTDPEDATCQQLIISRCRDIGKL